MNHRASSTLCVMPARGGSKRVPRKNIRVVRGVPMIARTIDIIIRSQVADLIVVSTEDAMIAATARDAGASVPFVRPDNLADDDTPTAPIVAHAIESVLPTNEHAFDLVLVVYPTAILLEPEDLRAAKRAIRESGATALMSVGRFPAPIERAWRTDPDGRGVMVEPANASTRTQDLSPAFFDAGQFYFGTLDFWRFDGRLAACRPLLHEIPADRAVDIDTEQDVRLAEARLDLRARLDNASTAAATDVPLGMGWNRGG